MVYIPKGRSDPSWGSEPRMPGEGGAWVGMVRWTAMYMGAPRRDWCYLWQMRNGGTWTNKAGMINCTRLGKRRAATLGGVLEDLSTGNPS